ncbi:MAG: hypothetical protein ABI960_04880 [Candidatus Eisenbacteria bacterium]
MFPLFSDRPLGAVLRSLGLVAAMASLLGASPAEARLRGTVHVTASDSSAGREITIDDEGIRIVGDDHKVVIPGDAGSLDGSGLPPGHGEVIRIRRMTGDSSSIIQVRAGGDNEIVQFFKDVHIEKGQQAGTVVAILGNVRNDGLISGDCVSILGSIVQGDSAVIRGEAVTIGGAVRSAGKGARVEGETVSIGFLPFAGWAVPSIALLLLFGLVSLLLFVALAAITGRLFPERLVRIADTISQRTFLSLGLGLLSIPLAFMIGLLLVVTVIGIPLAVLLPFLFLLAAFVGYTAAVYLLGSKLLGRRTGIGSGMLGPIAAGTGFVTLFYALGVPLMSLEGAGRVFGFGFVLLWLVIGTVCWMMGLGALLLSRLGQDPNASARRDSQWIPASPPPAAPPPPVSTT